MHPPVRPAFRFFFVEKNVLRFVEEAGPATVPEGGPPVATVQCEGGLPTPRAGPCTLRLRARTSNLTRAVTSPQTTCSLSDDMSPSPGGKAPMTLPAAAWLRLALPAGQSQSGSLSATPRHRGSHVPMPSFPFRDRATATPNPTLPLTHARSTVRWVHRSDGPAWHSTCRWAVGGRSVETGA